MGKCNTYFFIKMGTLFKQKIIYIFLYIFFPVFFFFSIVVKNRFQMFSFAIPISLVHNVVVFSGTLNSKVETLLWL